MNTAFIVCTRLNSNRLPSKAAININGKTILNHLHDRLKKTGIKIIYAIPTGEIKEFEKIFESFSGDFEVFSGPNNDPLLRMRMAAESYNIDTAIRVTHDKIFIKEEDVYKCLDVFHKKNLDYLYSTDFTPGSGFEIISSKALVKACRKFKGIEHISYSIKAVTKNQFNIKLENHVSSVRLLIDFPEDVDLMNVLMANLGNDCSFEDVIKFLSLNRWALNINKMPKITIYTCAYNASPYVMEAMASVSSQSIFSGCEYLLIDDHSTDDTSFKMSRFASCYENTRYIRNPENIGLASSSNIALSQARGQFIVRLDADDYFSSMSSIDDLYREIMFRDLDAIYPNNYFGKVGSVQKGSENHHCGGTMFRTKAINHVKFTEGLRNLEGYDVWARAKNIINIGYLNKPIFFYRQHDGSMSKINLTLREKTRAAINGQ